MRLTVHGHATSCNAQALLWGMKELGLSYERLEAELAIAEARLEASDHLCGDALTIADNHLGHVLHRYFDIGIDRSDLPAFGAYYRRLAGRPACRKTVTVSCDALKDTF
jgi:glutathione S-transferase